MAKVPAIDVEVGAKIKARRRLLGMSQDRLAEALGTLARDLPAAAVAAFEAAIPAGAAAGDRYAAEQMAMLDSERG